MSEYIFGGDPALEARRKLGHFYAPVCSLDEPEYALVDEEDGSPALKVVGSIPRYKQIQAETEGIALSSLIEQYKHTGDDSIFNVNEGFFADITEMPADRLSWENMLSRASTEFEQLPLNVRAKYDHNYKKFLKAVDDGSFVKDFSIGVKDAKASAEGSKLKTEAAKDGKEIISDSPAKAAG